MLVLLLFASTIKAMLTMNKSNYILFDPIGIIIRYASCEKQNKTPKTKENSWFLSVYTQNVFSCF